MAFPQLHCRISAPALRVIPLAMVLVSFWSGPAAAKPKDLLAQDYRWSAEAPIHPAGMVVTGEWVGLFGRDENGAWTGQTAQFDRTGIVVPSPPAAKEGEAAPVSAPPAWKETVLVFPEDLQPTAVFADRGAGVFVPEEGKRAAMVTLQEDGTLTAPIVFDVPLNRVDDVQLGDKRLYVLGSAGGATVVMHRFATAIGSADPWQASLPLLDGRTGAALFASGGQLMVTGGFVKSGESDTARPPDVYRAQLDETGAPSSWEMMVQRLPQGPGRSVGANAGGFLGLLGEVSLLEDGTDCTSQTLAFAYHRNEGRLTLWQSGVFDMPALEGALLEADEENSQFLVAGGRERDSGVQNRMLWSFGVPRTRETRDKFNAPLTIPLRRDEVVLVEHQAALTRAKSEEKFHLVLLAGDDSATTSNKAFVTRNRDALAVMKDFIVSVAGDEAAVDLRRKINQPEGAASVLLDPQGAVVGVQAGALDGARLYQLLKPAWEPVVPAP